jgi:hypothetical protein
MKVTLIGSIFSLALLNACGDGSPFSGNSLETASPESQQKEDTQQLGISLPKYKVQVSGGSGSGSYSPGETVYVWSGVKSGQVSTSWGGQAQLLQSPKEWATSFIMPWRDVSLSVQQTALELQFNVKPFKGATDRVKQVRYFFPANMRGVVFLNHGTGGSSDFVEKMEARAVALAFIQKGYGVISPEAEEAVAGDLNGDGKLRWNLGMERSNVDLRNLEMLLRDFETEGQLKSGIPRFSIGMSNGGAFSIFLGAIATSPIASFFPRLKFRAVTSYCADGSGTMQYQTQTPTAWYMCGNDDNVEVSNSEARNNHYSLWLRGVRTQYAEHPATPLYGERFTRISGISTELSRSLASEFRAAGFVNADGFFKMPTDMIVEEISKQTNIFPVFSGLSSEQKREVRSQIQTMQAEHSMYSDFAQRNIDFFE